MVFSLDRIPIAEALATQKRLTTRIRFNMKKEYYKFCGSVWNRMSLAIVRLNRQLLCFPQ